MLAFMSLMHIPVQILATQTAEAQAFADVLAGQAGSLALAGESEEPLVILVCPSGNMTVETTLPVIFLGERKEGMPENARVLPVPARLQEVLEALEEAATARAGFTQPRRYQGWRLDPVRLTLRTPSEGAIALTDTEARLLACLLDAAGGEVGREALLQRVWGYRPGLETHTLETHIYRLRKKIESDPANPVHIVTSGEGYKFCA